MKFTETHGLSRSRTYVTWQHMMDRCCNANSDAFPRYGGRGIEVCTRWYSFEEFLCDMGPRPDGYTLDRRDNDGHYEKDNCRWVTPAQQAQNRHQANGWGTTRVKRDGCGVSGCKRVHEAHGLCHKHYLQGRRLIDGGLLDDDDGWEEIIRVLSDGRLSVA